MLQARCQGLEETSSGLKARAEATAGHIAELERQLAHTESERRDAREKYVALVRRFEALQSHEEATRLGMQVNHLIHPAYLLGALHAITALLMLSP